MMDFLNWFADHWILTLFSCYLLFAGLEELIRAWRGKP